MIHNKPLVGALAAAMLLLAGCSTDRPSAPMTGSTDGTDLAMVTEAMPGSRSFCGEIDHPASLPTQGAPRGPQVAGTVAGFKTVYNTDMAVAGVGGLRNVGQGTITLAGLTGPVAEAWLYWNGPTNSEDPAVNAALFVNGTAVAGTNIGFSHDNCWGYDNTQSYRADVTELVQATGNGAYELTGLKTDGKDVSDGANTNGASLLVFFSDGNFLNNRDVVIFDGNDSNVASGYDPEGWDVMLSGIVYQSGTAQIQLHVADGQYGPVYHDDALELNGQVLEPGPDIFSGTSVPSANNGPMDNGNLWDIRRWDVVPFLSPGPNSLHLTTGQVADCLGLVVAIIDLPAGAAPGEPAFFTGGGHLVIDGARLTFGFNAGPRYLGDPPKGQLTFQNHETGMKVKSLSLAFFNSGMDCATFGGECLVDGLPGYYQAFVCDMAEPGHGADIFILTVWDADHVMVFQVADVLAGGNIQKHPLVDMVTVQGP